MRFERSPEVAIGLLTGNFEVIAGIKLDHYNLGRRFTFGGYGDHHFDRRDLLPMAIERARAAGVDAAGSRVVVIGDTPLDVDCAHAHGAVAVAVATGNYSAAQLDAAGADLDRRDSRRGRAGEDLRRTSQIDRRIPIEEIVRPEPERVPDGRHDRQILGSCEVVHAKVHPHHDVLVADGAVALTPRQQPVVSSTRDHVLAAGVALGRRRRP